MIVYYYLTLLSLRLFSLRHLRDLIPHNLRLIKQRSHALLNVLLGLGLIVGAVGGMVGGTGGFATGGDYTFAF